MAWTVTITGNVGGDRDERLDLENVLRRRAALLVQEIQDTHGVHNAYIKGLLAPCNLKQELT